jgi:hypothetical protein
MLPKANAIPRISILLGSWATIEAIRPKKPESYMKLLNMSEVMTRRWASVNVAPSVRL